MSVARHAAIRPSRAGRTVRASLAVALVGALLSAGGAPAQAVGEQVLQQVDVRLGTDGALTAVESTSVRRGEEGGEALQTALDTQEAAEELPATGSATRPAPTSARSPAAAAGWSST